jgi:hypothetical protein
MFFIVRFHITLNGDILFQDVLGTLAPEVYLDSSVICAFK